MRVVSDGAGGCADKCLNVSTFSLYNTCPQSSLVLYDRTALVTEASLANTECCFWVAAPVGATSIGLLFPQLTLATGAQVRRQT